MTIAGRAEFPVRWARRGRADIWGCFVIMLKHTHFSRCHGPERYVIKLKRSRFVFPPHPKPLPIKGRGFPRHAGICSPPPCGEGIGVGGKSVSISSQFVLACLPAIALAKVGPGDPLCCFCTERGQTPFLLRSIKRTPTPSLPLSGGGMNLRQSPSSPRKGEAGRGSA